MSKISVMHIAIDVSAHDPDSTDGVNTFVLGLIKGFINTIGNNDIIVLLVSRGNRYFFEEKFTSRNVNTKLVEISLFGRSVNRLIWILSWALRNYRLRYWWDKFFRYQLMRDLESSLDAIVVPTTLLNFYALDIPTILCIHDIQHEYFPKNFSRHQLILRWASYRLSSARATVIQVSSRFVKDCLMEKFLFLDKSRFLLAPEGVDVERFSLGKKNRRPAAIPEKLGKNFIFYPAQIWKHKNHLLLLEALALFRDRMGFETPCVLTGSDYGYWVEVERLRLKLELSSVVYLGRVEFEEIIWLYKHCSAVLALGVHESSSLPLREAAAFGKPVICTDIPPNVEISDLFELNMFRRDSPISLTNQLIRLYEETDDISVRASRNLKLVKKLDWDVIAKIYYDWIHLALNRN